MARQNNFLPGTSDSFYSLLTTNEQCEQSFNYSNLYEPYPGSSSGFLQPEHMAYARHFSGARMEQSSAGRQPSSNANNNASEKSATKCTTEKRKYETWSQTEQKLLVQLWAENHEWLESRESRTAWRKICDELNSRLDTNKTVEKCKKKMKDLIDKYKEAKEWNRKQTGGTRRQSIFYVEIDDILGCRDIVTLKNVFEAGTSASASSRSSSPLNTSTNSSSGAASPASSDDLDEQPDRNKRSEGHPKTKDARNDRKKQSKAQSRKRNRAAFEESEEEEKKELRESMAAFKKCGENLSNFMTTFSETQKQQMAMMGQFIGAMTQFMNKKPESSTD